MNIGIREASRFLCLSVNTVYHYVNAKKLPYYKIGRRVVFSKEKLERWLEDRKVEAIG